MISGKYLLHLGRNADSNHEIAALLHQHVIGFVKGVAVFAHQHEVAARAALPIEENIAPYDYIAAAGVHVVPLVAVFDDDVAARVVVVAPPASGKVVKENVVLDDDVGHTVDVNVLVVAGLVVEQVAL